MAWRWYALLSAVFAALTAILAKVGVRGVNGHLATAVRTSVVLVLAWGLVILNGQLKQTAQLSRANWTMLILSGVATGLSWIFYFKALETGEVSKVAPIDKLSVVLVMLFAFLFLGEPATLKSVLGGVLITAGAVLLAL